jgi:hypothetical protein
MPLVKCRCCDGEYRTIGPDGLRYFHACPPLVDEHGAVVGRRPGHRDENIDLQKAREADRGEGGRGEGNDPTARQKAPGAGVVVLDPDDPV